MLLQMIVINNIISAGHTIYFMEMLPMVTTSFRGTWYLILLAQSNQLLGMQRSNAYSVTLLNCF